LVAASSLALSSCSAESRFSLTSSSPMRSFNATPPPPPRAAPHGIRPDFVRVYFAIALPLAKQTQSRWVIGEGDGELDAWRACAWTRPQAPGHPWVSGITSDRRLERAPDRAARRPLAPPGL
jgi:hypothetical protein